MTREADTKLYEVGARIVMDSDSAEEAERYVRAILSANPWFAAVEVDRARPADSRSLA